MKRYGTANELLGAFFHTAVWCQKHFGLVTGASGYPAIQARTPTGMQRMRSLPDLLDLTQQIGDFIINQMLWAKSGFQVVEPSVELATNLMVTDLRGVEPIAPWPAFIVRLPPALLGTATDMFGPEDLAFALFAEVDSPDRRIRIDIYGLNGTTLGTCFNSISDMVRCLDAGESPLQWRGSLDLDKSDEDRRTEHLVARLLAGIMLEMETTPRRARPRTLSEKQTMRVGPTLASFYVLGRPMKIDHSDTVRDYVRSGGATPTVRSLVRGHWKRQPCGVRGEERKLIHVEPYWRGPDGAPVLIRPVQLGGDEPAATKPS